MGISAAQMQVGSGQAGPEEYGEIAYGIAPRFIQTGTWAKILSMIFSPVVIIIIIILAFVLGAIIFIRRRNKNPKKKS